MSNFGDKVFDNVEENISNADRALVLRAVAPVCSAYAEVFNAVGFAASTAAKPAARIAATLAMAVVEEGAKVIVKEVAEAASFYKEAASKIERVALSLEEAE